MMQGDTNKIDKTNQKIVSGGNNEWLNDKPAFTGQVGIYKDEDIWVLGHMMEQGHLHEVGRYVSKEKAESSAEEYIKELKKLG